MRGRSRYLYFLFVLTGLLSWLNNLRQTADPVTIYGNDVFDSYQYFWGYAANKLNLFSSWVIVYPLVGFMLLSMSFSARRILKELADKGAFSPNVLHPDGCYGMRNLGLLNLALLTPYVLSYGVIFCLLLTHEVEYFSVVFALVGLTIALIVSSFITIGPITGVGRRARQETYSKLLEKNETYTGNRKRLENRFAFERICFDSANASPYRGWASSAINLIRILPVLITTIRLVP